MTLKRSPSGSVLLLYRIGGAAVGKLLHWAIMTVSDRRAAPKGSN